jgi:hypothetical protein
MDDNVVPRARKDPWREKKRTNEPPHIETGVSKFSHEKNGG